MGEVERLRQENEQLRRDNEALQRETQQNAIEAKKLNRTIKLLEVAIERNKVSAAAKDNLSRTIDEKRSELERYMNLLLGNCPDIILLFDRDGRLAYCTESFLTACRLPSFGLIRGTPYHQLFAAHKEKSLTEALVSTYRHIFEDKKTTEFSATIGFSPESTPRHYSVHVTPMLDVNGGAEGSMIIFTDTTDFLLAQQEAERANASKSEFLATVSHEIRTPMNAIIGFAEMLKTSKLDNKQHEYLKNIQNSSVVLLNLINDILDFSKIEAGKLEIVPEYFISDGLFKHVQSMFELMFEKKGLAFVYEYDPNIPKVLLGDEGRIRQILTNLLNNALKYTKEGTVHFRAHVDDTGQIVFRVTDTGVGIAPEAIPFLFDAFERLDSSKNKGVVGTGLGLAITKRLCDLMGGSIEVSSEYGKGSSFAVTLPLPSGSEEDLPPESISEAAKFIASDVRVLVVDDIDINLQITAYMLEVFEITPDFAMNGRQAVEKASERRYDLILMDHMMPEMDGVQATTLIRSTPGPSRDAPIIALTANAVSDAEGLFMKTGFNGLLPKPIDSKYLAECLLQWLPPSKITMLG